jgi:hypothetical protein
LDCHVVYTRPVALLVRYCGSKMSSSRRKTFHAGKALFIVCSAYCKAMGILRRALWHSGVMRRMANQEVGCSSRLSIIYLLIYFLFVYCHIGNPILIGNNQILLNIICQLFCKY